MNDRLKAFGRGMDFARRYGEVEGVANGFLVIDMNQESNPWIWQAGNDGDTPVGLLLQACRDLDLSPEIRECLEDLEDDEDVVTGFVNGVVYAIAKEEIRKLKDLEAELRPLGRDLASVRYAKVS